MTNRMTPGATPVHSDADLTISYLPGQGDRLVVAFTGIGLQMGGIQQEEFAGTASQGQANHVVFVTDRRRSWYSTPGIQDRIVEQVGRLIADRKIARVVCLGNSMGGHGALLFARRLGAEVAIAFVPQYSMDPAVVAERRWSQFHCNIHVAGLGNLAHELSPTVMSHVFYGADDAPDHPHCRLMIPHSAGEGVNVYVLRDVDHDAASILKTRGLLRPAITAMIDRDRPGLLHCLRDDLAETHISNGAYAHDAV